MDRRLFLILLILLLTSLWLTPVLAQDPFPPLSEAITPPEPNGPFALSEDVITYQGLLQVSGVEAVGIYDFQFRVFSTLSGGVQVGSTLPADNVNIATGIFSVQLNFGESVFTGEERWLEIAVKADASGSYTILAPRQQVTPAPMALALPGLWTSRNPFSPNLMGGYEGNSTNPNAIGQTIGGVVPPAF